TSFTPFEGRVRQLLAETPDMPATGLAGRGGWGGWIPWFRSTVRRLRPGQGRPGPADRLSWAAGDAAQCDLWFPPRKIPLEDGSTAPLTVLEIWHNRRRHHSQPGWLAPLEFERTNTITVA